MDHDERMHKLRSGSDTAVWAADRIAELDAENNSLAHQLNQSNERNGRYRAALREILEAGLDAKHETDHINRMEDIAQKALEN